MPERSMSAPGIVSRSFIAGNSDMPPAIGWLSAPLAEQRHGLRDRTRLVIVESSHSRFPSTPRLAAAMNS